MPNTPLTDAINALTDYANEITGQTDETLSDAVHTLADGYGQGGGQSPFAESKVVIDSSASMSWLALKRLFASAMGTNTYVAIAIWTSAEPTSGFFLKCVCFGSASDGANTIRSNNYPQTAPSATAWSPQTTGLSFPVGTEFTIYSC